MAHGMGWSPKRRLESKLVEDGNGCLVWTGAVSSSGYGNIYYKGRWLGTHRLAFMLHFDVELDETEDVHHEKCENKLCCNVDHLLYMDHGEHAGLHSAMRSKSFLKWLAEQERSTNV